MRDEVLIALEQRVFAHIMQDPSLAFQLTPGDFVSENGSKMIEVLQKHSDQKWSAETVYFWMAEAHVDVHKDIIRDFFVDDEAGSDDFSALKETLHKESVKRRMKDIVVDGVGRRLESKNELSPEDLAKVITELSRGLAEIEDGGKFKLFNSEELLREYVKIMESRKVQKGFWDTGCSHLNSLLTEGFPPQKITSIFAPSGIGKSSYALYLVNRQINVRIPSVYVTLEMDMASTMDRLIAMRNQLPLRMFYRRSSDEPNDNFALIQTMIDKERGAMLRNPFFRLVDKPGLSIANLEEIVEQAKREMGVNYLICTVDLMSMVREFNFGEGSTADKYEHAMNMLHEVARRSNCHFVCVFQAKRNSIPVTKEEDVEKLRPKIEHIKNSGAIEERSRIIISLYRKRFYLQRYFPNSPMLETTPDLMEVGIEKQNMGRLGRAMYWFDPESSYLCKYEETPEIKPFDDKPPEDENQNKLNTGTNQQKQ